MKIVSQNNNEVRCFIKTISIGRRLAGGFLLTPKAIADDGLLDVCFVQKICVPRRLKILSMVPKGNHLKDSKVNYYQTENLKIEFKTQVPFHVDGELFFAEKFDIGLFPKAMNVIYNNVGKHFFAKT